MAIEQNIVCDNDDCRGGKHFQVCGNGHDICSLCVIEKGKESFCPICFNKAKLLR